MTILLAGLIVISTSGPAWAAQLDTTLNPNNAESPFKMSYLKTVFIEYPNGGDYWRQAVFYKILVDNYDQKSWQVVSSEFDFIEPNAKKEIKSLLI